MKKWKAVMAGLVLTMALGSVTACGTNNDNGTNGGTTENGTTKNEYKRRQPCG